MLPTRERPAVQATHAATCETCHGAASDLRCSLMFHVANLVSVAIVGGAILVLTTVAILLVRFFR